MMVKEVIPAGTAAAIASLAYRERKTLSTKCMMVIEAVLMMSG
jgi:hypothetical protein